MGSRLLKALGRARIPVIAAGRRREQLERAVAGVEPRPRSLAVSATDGPGLRRAIGDLGVRAVISCAGPALDLGTAVLDAALGSGAHYLDAATEPSFVAHVLHEYAGAGRPGPVAAVGCGARGAVGQWASEVAIRSLGANPDEVAIAWGHAPSTHLRPSVAAWLGAAGEGMYRRAAGAGFPVQRSFGFPPPFGEGIGLQVPGPEEALLRAAHRDTDVRTYIALAPGGTTNRLWAAWEAATGSVIPALCRVLLSQWGRMHLDMYFPGPPADARDAVSLVAQARAKGRGAQIAVIADDLYALSVAALELTLRRLLSEPPRSSGAVDPARIVDPSTALSWLARSGSARIFASPPPSSSYSTSTRSTDPGTSHAP